MSALRCLFGMHGAHELVRDVEHRGGRMVVVGIIRCARCGARIAEEVIPVAELPASGDGAL